ncbi:hypothetical protein ADUPG1_009330 [Aduncisulcus paluster]|uniref:Uncharacterized protein n=1 Tax=Aduncisulcus paluster TaxID=2918883 RepID=A0ABQ5KV92_9EUKA|nr:hypothetical protein ADUPG1_009330 [Aduncisulcus paluster]
MLLPSNSSLELGQPTSIAISGEKDDKQVAAFILSIYSCVQCTSLFFNGSNFGQKSTLALALLLSKVKSSLSIPKDKEGTIQDSYGPSHDDPSDIQGDSKSSTDTDGMDHSSGLQPNISLHVSHLTDQDLDMSSLIFLPNLTNVSFRSSSLSDHSLALLLPIMLPRIKRLDLALTSITFKGIFSLAHHLTESGSDEASTEVGYDQTGHESWQEQRITSKITAPTPSLPDGGSILDIDSVATKSVVLEDLVLDFIDLSKCGGLLGVIMTSVPSLISVSLGNCSISDSTFKHIDFARCSVRNLSLWSNNLSDIAAKHLSVGLKHFIEQKYQGECLVHPLQELILADNRIGHIGFSEIMAILAECNPVLRKLPLDDAKLVAKEREKEQTKLRMSQISSLEANSSSTTIAPVSSTALSSQQLKTPSLSTRTMSWQISAKLRVHQTPASPMTPSLPHISSSLKDSKTSPLFTLCLASHKLLLRVLDLSDNPLGDIAFSKSQQYLSKILLKQRDSLALCRDIVYGSTVFSSVHKPHPRMRTGRLGEEGEKIRDSGFGAFRSKFQKPGDDFPGEQSEVSSTAHHDSLSSSLSPSQLFLLLPPPLFRLTLTNVGMGLGGVRSVATAIASSSSEHSPFDTKWNGTVGTGIAGGIALHPQYCSPLPPSSMATTGDFSASTAVSSMTATSQLTSQRLGQVFSSPGSPFHKTATGSVRNSSLDAQKRSRSLLSRYPQGPSPFSAQNPQDHGVKRASASSMASFGSRPPPRVGKRDDPATSPPLTSSAHVEMVSTVENDILPDTPVIDGPHRVFGSSVMASNLAEEDEISGDRENVSVCILAKQCDQTLSRICDEEDGDMFVQSSFQSMHPPSSTSLVMGSNNVKMNKQSVFHIPTPLMPFLFTQLDISDNCITDGGGVILCGSVRNCVTLKSLGLAHCGVGRASMNLLASVLRVRHNITELDVSGNGLGDEGVARLIASVRASRLESLCLNNNSLSNTSVTSLSESMKDHPSLRTLSLRSNSISYNGILVLSRCIPFCPQLKRLHLGGNPLDSPSFSLLTSSCEIIARENKEKGDPDKFICDVIECSCEIKL